MTDFSDLIAALQSDTPPVTIYDDLTAAYGERAQLAESAGARVAELEAANAALLAEIGDLKARNYDLLVRVGEDSPADVAGGDGAGEDERAETITVDDLFKEDE